MTYIVKIPNGIICMSETSFECPKCHTKYSGERESERLHNAKRMLIYKRCTTCRSWIGITSDIQGDIRSWLKEDELVNSNRSAILKMKSFIK